MTLPESPSPGSAFALDRDDRPESRPEPPADRSPVTEQPDGFLVVGIGASAGGLAALETFFDNIPPTCGMAFVLVPHLAPDHESLLPDLLSARTTLPISSVFADVALEPNRIYVIAPNSTLTVAGRNLHVVSPPVEPRGRRNPIDHFFRSLARERGDRAVCIILSGNGTDGTAGLTAVKEFGGMAMAQDPVSAKYDAILRSAIATGLVDHILPAREMGAVLCTYAEQLSRESSTARDPDAIAAHLPSIFRLLKGQTDHDFRGYKPGTVIRRTRRRMQALGLDRIGDYVDRLHRDSGEVEFLFKDLLVGVTRFFRDEPVFRQVAATIVPAIFAGKEAGDQVRVCVYGCSTGEEVYSLAMLIREHAATLPAAPHTTLFGADIDEAALAIARNGVYSRTLTADVSPERVSRFFVEHGEDLRVVPEIREMCIFSTHSVIRDPPFSRLDLISCRNVLIYLGSDHQQRLMRLFHYSLVPKGFLLLGSSENPTRSGDLFEPLDRELRIFRRSDRPARSRVMFPSGAVAGPRGKADVPDDGARVSVRGLERSVERALLDQISPAAAVFTEDGHALHFSGPTDRFVAIPTGPHSSEVSALLKEGLRLPFRAALRDSVQLGTRSIQRGTVPDKEGASSPVVVEVEPLRGSPGDSRLFVAVFRDEPAAPAAGQPESAEDGAHVRLLEQELRVTQERLNTIIDELETVNQETTSANEEFQASNEELETSKEELQSLNEEIETVNGELHRKIEDLDRANSDLRNLLDSTQIATLFLDKDLRVRAFTPPSRELFRLFQTDVGRPISDFAQRFVDADLAGDAKAVLERGEPIDRELRAAVGDTRYLLRIVPYRKLGNGVDGVVATFTDVTEITKAGERAQDAQRFAESVVGTVREALLVLDSSLRIRSANRAFYETFATTAAETIDHLLVEVAGGVFADPPLLKLLTTTARAGEGYPHYELLGDLPAGRTRVLETSAARIPSDSTGQGMVLLAIEDVTDRRASDAALEASTEDLLRSNEELHQFAYIVGHDLHEPMRTISTHTQLLERRMGGNLDDDARRLMANVVGGAARMQAMLRDLQSFTRVGSTNALPEAVPSGEELSEAISVLETAIAESGAVVDRDPLPVVRFAPGRLRLLFQNLLANAIKFHDGAPPRIHVSAARDGDFWVISVRDQGIGIESRELERIFDVFYRSHHRGEYPGTGIGLAICRKMAEQNGGSITAESVVGRGATFRVRLLAAESPQAETARPRAMRA